MTFHIFYPGSSLSKASRDRPDPLDATPAPEHSSSSELPLATVKVIKAPPRKKAGALLDSIRTKVLNTPEDVILKGALKSSSKARKPVVPREDGGLRTVVRESGPSGHSDTELPVLLQKVGRVKGGSPRASVNGTVLKVAPSEGGVDVISHNGAFWAVAAAASKIANGGVVEREDTGAEGSLLRGVSKRGAVHVNGAPSSDWAVFEVSDLTGSDGAQDEGASEQGAVVRGGKVSKAAQEGGIPKAKSRKAGPANASGQRTAFEEGVMEALRKNMIKAVRENRPVVAEPQFVSSANTASEAESRGALDEVQRPAVSGIEEENGRQDSGLSASTSGRDATPVRKARKAKVSLATEILIEQALSEGEAAEAPAKRTRKRVQKVVAVEGPETGEGERPKRVRKRVRVRAAEVESGSADVDGAGKASTDVGKGGEGSEVFEGSKEDSRSFRARHRKLPALGAATSLLERGQTQAGRTSKPAQTEATAVRERHANGTAPAVSRSMILGAASESGPTAVRSLGGSGRAPKLATQSVNRVLPSAAGSRKVNTEVTVEDKTGSLNLAMSQVPLGAIQALRASSPSAVSGESGTGVKAPQVANRAGSGLVLDDVEKGLRGPNVATNRVVVGSLDEKTEESSAGGPKVATMKVPLGPIAALRAAVIQPAKELGPAVSIVDDILEGGPIQALRKSAVSAVVKPSVPMDYLSDLEEGEDFEFGGGRVGGGPIQALRCSGGRAGVETAFGAAPLDYLSDLEEEEEQGERTAEFPEGGSFASGVQGAPPPLKSNYYSDHLMESHPKTKSVWGRQEAHSKGETFLEQFDYSVEPPETEETEELAEEPITDLPMGGQRKRRRALEAKPGLGESVTRGPEESPQREQKTTGGGKPSGEFLLMYATWRDLSEGRLDPAGYEMVSEKTGAVIGVVRALEPLTPAAEKEMEETGLQLHTGVLRMTAVEGFIEEYEREQGAGAGFIGVPTEMERRGGVDKERESASALFGKGEVEGSGNVTASRDLDGEDWHNVLGELEGEEGDESDSDWEEIEDDSDLLASLDELKAAVGGSESDGEEGGAVGAAQREYAIPVIGEYIADVSVRERRIRVALPGSLDRISRRPAILRGLGMALYK